MQTRSWNPAGPLTPVEKAKGGVRSNETEAVSDEYVKMDSWSAGSVLSFVSVEVLCFLFVHRNFLAPNAVIYVVIII